MGESTEKANRFRVFKSELSQLFVTFHFKQEEIHGWAKFQLGINLIHLYSLVYFTLVAILW